MEPLRLGPFELGDEISRGGMGVVVHAIHSGTGRSVAVKVLSGDRAGDPVFLRSFRREVRSVAALDHPRIITVYDFGLIPAELAGHHDAFTEGSPWIAMEHAAFGSLHGYPTLAEWRDLQSVLFDILDGLAHAHARDLVHRDLKPGNVLLVPEGSVIRCKLSDFGIAHARGSATSTHEVFASAAGTPLYMAPEQVESQWRNYGPWTDLYALGAMTFQLVTGRPPFDGKSAVEVARKQLFERPPPIGDTQLAVPDGLEAWIHRLLEKEIRNRFQRAADALWALRQISPENPSGMRVPVSRPPILSDPGADTIPSPAPTADEADTALTTLTFDRGFDFGAFPSLDELSSPSVAAATMPPVPDDWRHRRARHSAMLGGAGLGLFGLRETPFVAREAERDLIWSALKHVAERRVAQGILLQGPSGVGKSRLAEWVARRAHEVGAAKVLVARHGPMSGGFDGIRRMLDHYAGTTGLDIERTYERLRHQLAAQAVDPVDLVRYRAAALARFLRPESTSARVPPVRIAGPDELFGILRGTLIRYSRNRPVLVILRDVQWAPEAVELANRVLATQDAAPAPLLLIATVRDDLPEGDSAALDALDRLSRRGNVVRRSLEPLADEALKDLIDGVVELSPDLRDELVAATRGNPLFCLQLLGHWIEEGELRPGPSGFVRRHSTAMPASAYDLWLTRLDAAASQFPGEPQASMEVAAALGVDVAPWEWRDACELLGYTVATGMVDSLIERGLIQRSTDTWEFGHEMLREALVDRARRAGRAERHHAAVAEVLTRAVGSDARARRARHLELSGRVTDAVAEMTAVADELVDRALFDQAERMIARAERLVPTAGLPPNSRIRGRLLAARGHIWLARGDLDRALEAFDNLSRDASRHDWPELLVRAMHGASTVLQNTGEVSDALTRLQTALSVARTAELPLLQIRAARSLGWLHQRSGESETAQQLIAESIRLAESLDGAERERAISMAAMAEVTRARGATAEARTYAEEAVKQMRRFGDRVGIGDALNVLADIERKSGNYDAAEVAYREAMESYDLAGHTSGDLVRANLAMLALRRGRPIEAQALLEQAAHSFEEYNMSYYLAFARFGLAQTAAALGDGDTFDDLHEVVSRLDHDFYELEFLEIAVATAHAWVARGDAERARRAASLAVAMLDVVGNITDEIDADVRALAEGMK